MSTKLVAVVVAVVAALMGISLIFASPGERLVPPSGGAGSSSGEILAVGAVISPTQSVSPSLKMADAIVKYFSTQEFSSTVPFSVTVDTVVDLKQAGMGYGGIFKALYYAAISGESVESIVELHQSGMGWGEIKKDIDGLEKGKQPNLGAAVSSAAKNKGASVEDDSEEGTSERAAKKSDSPTAGSTAVRPEKAGPPEHSNAGGNGKGNSGNAPGQGKK